MVPVDGQESAEIHGHPECTCGGFCEGYREGLPGGIGRVEDYSAGEPFLWQDVRRNKQSQALKFSSGAWSSDQHPELAEGGAAYVEKLRSEPDERFEGASRADEKP